jgi:hypothetical protein
MRKCRELYQLDCTIICENGHEVNSRTFDKVAGCTFDPKFFDLVFHVERSEFRVRCTGSCVCFLRSDNLQQSFALANRMKKRLASHNANHHPMKDIKDCWQTPRKSLSHP